jgi:hypothetical protein
VLTMLPINLRAHRNETRNWIKGMDRRASEIDRVASALRL